ncbi:MAG TPA: UDP-N-acetylmuramoyl-L-alanyl-D-glutamate--2,6-diaminopimelate ligase [Myxococcota bacterium]|nr:UDP-N-acetylmuramoyl-L-alanyl-D-glutamate--2,6-diaminopimelate ligase [Myxococcota bacterium]
MRRSTLLQAAAGTVLHAPAGDPDVGDVRHDSREVRPGDLFVALRGDARDGHRHLDEVAVAGAAAVVGTDAAALQALVTSHPALAAAVVQVADGREALWRLCRARYRDDLGDLALLGVTGTNGKTTVCFVVESILAAARRRPGVLGTVSYRFAGREEPASHTTPEAPALWRLLAAMRRDGATDAVMEVSSHALALRRADGVPFAVTAFTNLTQDHLDFHSTFKDYWRAKRRLFTEVAPQAPAVVNVDDPTGAGLAAELGARAVRTSAEGLAGAEVAPVDRPALDVAGIRCTLRTPAGDVQVRSPLLGAHNLANLCTAAGMAAAAGVGAAAIAAGIAALPGVPGRLERVAPPAPAGVRALAAPGGAPGVPVAAAAAAAAAAPAAPAPAPAPALTRPHVFVDYAHTPDALARVLAAMRPHTAGRLVVMFGCGGDRDGAKRPLMGAVATQRADVVVVTSDNPRTEDPAKIIDDIRPGLGAGPAEVHVEPDRRAAIALALHLARPGDVVLLAGKGHETYQILGTRRVPFDDRVVAAALLAEAIPA